MKKFVGNKQTILLKKGKENLLFLTFSTIIYFIYSILEIIKFCI